MAAAHRRGEAGTCQVRRLGRVHANRRVRQTMPLSEPFFLGWAKDESFRGFDQVWRDTDGRWQFRRPDGTTIQGHRAPPREPPTTDAHGSPHPGDRTDDDRCNEDDTSQGGLAAG